MPNPFCRIVLICLGFNQINKNKKIRLNIKGVNIKTPFVCWKVVFFKSELWKSELFSDVW